MARAGVPSDPESPFWPRAAETMALFQRDRLLEVLRALSQRELALREATLAGALEMLSMTPEVAAAWAARDGNPPPRTYPTEADCREALGLPRGAAVA